MPWRTGAGSTGPAPSSSTQLAVANAWIESFNGKLRDEFLNIQVFATLLEAQVLLEAWRIDYNTKGRHAAPLLPVAARLGVLSAAAGGDV